MSAELDRYITANELAEMLRVTRGAVYSFVRRGILPPGIKLGNSRRWSLSEINKTLKG